MNICFCCTSMFHLFVTIFICLKYYSEENYHKTLVLLSSLHAMCKRKEALESTGIWDEVIIIDNDGKEHAYIWQQLDKIAISQIDTFHIFGFEHVSFMILHTVSEKTKVIFTDEGYSTWDIRYWVEMLYCRDDFNGKEFPLHKISEVWMFDSRLSKNDFLPKAHDLNVKLSMQDTEFKERFYHYLMEVWPMAEDAASKIKGDIVFFDSYYSGMGWMSTELDDYILKEIIHAAEEYGIMIKQHPNDNVKNKYAGIDCTVLDNSDIPWEVMNLLADVREGLICMTCASNAILNRRIIWEDFESPIILLFKIYKDYSNVSANHEFIEKYMEVYGSQGIYIPENFGELSAIIRKLRGKEEKDIDELMLEEIKRSNNFFKNCYLHLWKKLPSSNNVSTLILGDEQIVVPIVIDSETGRRKVVFELDKRGSAEEGVFQWYAVRGMAIRIKIIDILAYRENVVESIKERFDKRNVLVDEDGYYHSNSFDPVYFIHYPLNSVKRIEIDFDYICHKSYDEAVSVYREGIRDIEQSNKILLADIGGRDKVIEELNVSILQRDKLYADLAKQTQEQSVVISQLDISIRQRDDIVWQLKEDMKQRDSVNSQLSEDIKQRDDVMRQLNEDMKQRDDVIRQLMSDIAQRDERYREICIQLETISDICREKEKEVEEFRQSKLGALYLKKRKRK